MGSFEDDSLRGRIQTFGTTVKRMRLRYDLNKKQKTAICDLRLNKNKAFTIASDLTAALTRLPGILEVEWA
jgi:hypothetical protein